MCKMQWDHIRLLEGFWVIKVSGRSNKSSAYVYFLGVGREEHFVEISTVYLLRMNTEGLMP